MDDSPKPEARTSWKAPLVRELERVALRDRWGVALMAVGWIHLGFFMVCQVLFWNGDRSRTHFLGLWGAEFAVNLWAIRRIAGRGWAGSTPLAGVIARIWATFLILSFNLASLNTLTGFAVDWFKPVWATLSTFGFATTAYVTNVWFFVPAVQMYFTGLIMALYPEHNYAIYGVSWWVSLQGIGLVLERRRLRHMHDEQLSHAEAETASAAA